MGNHHLRIAEFIFVIGSFIGLGVAVASGQVIYGVVAVCFSLLLNLINRLRLEQRVRRRIGAVTNQLYRQLSQESKSQQEQQMEEAVAALEAKLKSYLTPEEFIKPQPGNLELGQLQAKLTSLEESLSSVVKYLKGSSLTARIDHLEQVITSTRAEIARINHQFPETGRKKNVAELQLLTPLQPQYAEVGKRRNNEDERLPSWQSLRVLKGHEDWVSSLAISPNGQILASGSFDKTIKLWQISTGEQLQTLSDHSEGILSIAMSQDGQTLISGSFDQTIKLWHLGRGELIDTLTGHTSSVRSLAISHDGQTLISGSFDETIKLWNLERREFLSNLTEKAGKVTAIALTPDGQTVTSAGEDGTISLWQLGSDSVEGASNLPKILKGNLSPVCSLAISPNGQIIAAGCSDGKVKLWQLGTPELRAVFAGHSEKVMSLVFGYDGRTLISGSGDGTTRIWSLGTGETQEVLTNEVAEPVMSVATSPDSPLIAVASVDGSITIWQGYT